MGSTAPISVEMVPLMCTLLSVPVLECGTLALTADQRKRVLKQSATDPGQRFVFPCGSCQIMKSTKVQTLGELRMRDAANLRGLFR